MPRHRLLISIALLTSLAACGSRNDAGPSGTLGDRGRVEFSYRRSCFFGCPLEQPLLAGTSELIALDGEGNAAGVEAASSDDAVAVFTLERDCYCERADGRGGRVEIAEDASCAGMAHDRKRCENTVRVGARAPGTATLELRDRRGDVLDEVDVLVAEADRARFRATLPGSPGAVEIDALELDEGESADLELTLYDADGRALLAPENVTWRVADESVATVSGFLTGARAEITVGLEATITAQAAGETTLTIDVAGKAPELAIRIR